MNYFVGIDLGSRTSKIILLSQDNKIVFSDVENSGVNPKKVAQNLLENTLKKTSIKREDIKKIFSTGYGRNIVPFADKKISEITCHAKGVNFLFPQARSIIDIGGQDSKGIVINEKGRVLNFVMNDRCAAGTGRFLEVAATILELTVEDLGDLALKSKGSLSINSTCVVFAESEIIGLISQGIAVEDIIDSVHRSIAKRTKSMISVLGYKPPMVFTGGVAKNIGMRKALEDLLGFKLLIPKNSFITGALGAAVLAKESYL